MYVLYVTGENGKEVIGRYESLADGAMAMDLYRAEHDDNNGYMLIREGDDDRTGV